MIRIAIVIASTRPGRRGEQVASWVTERTKLILRPAQQVEFAVVDLVDASLPMLDEPTPAAIGRYTNEHTQRWAKLISSFDGFIFVTPEYNHSVPASLKNAIDYLFAEWNDKAAAFVSYGMNGGVRAVEHLRLILAEVKVAGVRSQVTLGLFEDFTISDMSEPGIFTPADRHLGTFERMLGELVEWSRALSTLRSTRGSFEDQGHAGQ